MLLCGCYYKVFRLSLALFFVWLVFYDPVNTMNVISSRPVNLFTLFLDRNGPPSGQPVLSAHTFANNWQLPFLNQRKGEMAIDIISCPISMEVIWRGEGSNSRPLDLHLDTLSNALESRAIPCFFFFFFLSVLFNIMNTMLGERRVVYMQLMYMFVYFVSFLLFLLVF